MGSTPLTIEGAQVNAPGLQGGKCAKQDAGEERDAKGESEGAEVDGEPPTGIISGKEEIAERLDNADGQPDSDHRAE